MRIISWSVNGVRAVFKKDFENYVLSMNPDIPCLQETKANPKPVQVALDKIDGYHINANWKQYGDEIDRLPPRQRGLSIGKLVNGRREVYFPVLCRS